MAFFSRLEVVVTSYADKVPLEIFSFAGSFVEEVIAPIPSPIIMTVTGGLASVQEKPLAFLFLLSLLGASGKVLGATVLYFFADKLEDLLLVKFGRFFGVTHKEVESVGKHISGSWKDVLILTFIRTLPIVPSAPVSIACGLLKVKRRVFWISTFLGTIVRDGIYLYIGYSGLSTLHTILTGLNTMESLLQGLIFLGFVILIGYLYHKRKKGRIFEELGSFFSNKRR